MAKVRTTTRLIPAPREEVWDVLADTASWGQWNPVFQGARGTLALGARLVLRAGPLRLPVRVTAAARGERLAWDGGVPGVFGGHHQFRLEAAEGGTLLHHEEDFRGLLGLLLVRAAGTRVQAAYERIDAALVRRFETQES